MWLRRIGHKGNAEAVVIPVSAMRALGWECGDFLIVQMLDAHSLVLSKFKMSDLPDRVRVQIDPAEIIHA